MSITLNTVASGYNLQAINDNFSALQSALNNNIVWRTGSVAGETLMVRDLDMNGNNILNIGTDLSLPGSLITVGEADARYVNIAGDTLEGVLNTDGNSITGLPASVNASDAVRKSELDAEASFRLTQDTYLQDQIIGAQPIPASQRPVVQWHSNHLSSSFTVPAEMNAFSIGPQLAIDPGQTVTLGTNSTWSILGNAYSMDALYNLKANTITTSDNTSTVTVANLASVAGTGVVPVTAGGTGASTAETARTNLGVAPLASPSFTGTVTIPTLSLTNASPLPGVTNASNAAAGKVGEVIAGSATGVSASSGVVFNAAALTLTPGDWELYSAVEFLVTSAPTSLTAGTSTVNATSEGFPFNQQLSASFSSGTHRLSAPVRRINVSASTVMYTIGIISFPSGTATCQGRMYAIRMR